MHSEKLEETTLWKCYQRKLLYNSERGIWVKKIYEVAAKSLLDVRETFKNYTLHDETHILNVLDAMGGLLGDQIENLTVGEAELLILAASLHDLGMVYGDDERKQCYEDKAMYDIFLKKYRPDLIGYLPEEWEEDVRQYYLRTLHPFRIADVLQDGEWRKLLAERPLDIVPMENVLAVCQAHGKEPKELCIDEDLEYLSASAIDPLFCSLLLRLGDLLDFDDTRAPKILYKYVACNDKSCKEWDKHQASAGFRYPQNPSTDDLPYKARCTNPGIEHAIKDFLDWVDEELNNCSKLQKYCKRFWQQNFPFPRAILRDEIEADGYMSGDFCMTMDQEQILQLLTGENLYDSPEVFVRELLQNAIDATLLRGEMDTHFQPENSRIDFWKWNDEEGNIWFRIDDRGTGMTLGMLQRYFLKVGNSYYTSRELERDLSEHNQERNYQGISCFGIGFLSCFLCGDYAEVSTLYFDSEKNRREESAIKSYGTAHYGLRLQVTGLSGYYTLKSQAKQHLVERPLPIPDCYKGETLGRLERNGYRIEPGTSIVIRLNPGKLGNLNLYEVVESYLCGAEIPVFYNGKRIGRTYKEIKQMVRKASEKKFYELSSERKQEFDRCFPAIAGHYPKISVEVLFWDKDEDVVLPELSVLVIKYGVQFGDKYSWKIKDVFLKIEFRIEDEKIIFEVQPGGGPVLTLNDWPVLQECYGKEKTDALAIELEKYSTCPLEGKQLGETWVPFEKKFGIRQLWESYYAYQQRGYMEIPIKNGYPNMNELTLNRRYSTTTYVHQGVVIDIDDGMKYVNETYGMFFLGDRWKPRMKLDRSRIEKMAPEISVACYGIFEKCKCVDILGCRIHDVSAQYNLAQWRKIRNPQLNVWMKKHMEEFFLKKKQDLQRPKKSGTGHECTIGFLSTDNQWLHRYLQSYLQDNYQMTVNYEKGGMISFEKREQITDAFDLFPPLMFCVAASDQSRQYVCATDPSIRRCITLDHPFVVWLLENSFILNLYYKRQFQQLIECLMDEKVDKIIKKYNEICKQFVSLGECHGIDIKSLPNLGEKDFFEQERDVKL